MLGDHAWVCGQALPPRVTGPLLGVQWGCRAGILPAPGRLPHIPPPLDRAGVKLLFSTRLKTHIMRSNSTEKRCPEGDRKVQISRSAQPCLPDTETVNEHQRAGPKRKHLQGKICSINGCFYHIHFAHLGITKSSDFECKRAEIMAASPLLSQVKKISCMEVNFLRQEWDSRLMPALSPLSPLTVDQPSTEPARTLPSTQAALKCHIYRVFNNLSWRKCCEIIRAKQSQLLCV